MAEEFSFEIFNEDFMEFFIDKLDKKFDKKFYSVYGEFTEYEIIDSESIRKNNKNLTLATNINSLPLILEDSFREIKSTCIRNKYFDLIYKNLNYL